jgi:hypothetical protein
MKVRMALHDEHFDPARIEKLHRTVEEGKKVR